MTACNNKLFCRNYHWQYLVEHHKSLVDSIAVELQPLLSCHVHRLHLTLHPASVSLTWNIKPSKWLRFFNLCRKAMESFKQLCFRLEDIRQNRLDRVLNSLRCFVLCPPVRDSTWAPEEFLEVIRESCKKATAVRRLWQFENSEKIQRIVWNAGNSAKKLVARNGRDGADRVGAEPLQGSIGVFPHFDGKCGCWSRCQSSEPYDVDAAGQHQDSGIVEEDSQQDIIQVGRSIGWNQRGQWSQCSADAAAVEHRTAASSSSSSSSSSRGQSRTDKTIQWFESQIQVQVSETGPGQESGDIDADRQREDSHQPTAAESAGRRPRKRPGWLSCRKNWFRWIFFL